MEDVKCAVTAPTGLASFIVGEVTIFRLLQLPIEHEGKEAGYWNLSKASQKYLKTALRKLTVLVIDEVSMVSSPNHTYIHLRLQEIMGGNEWFGGVNVMFVGDLLQLQPVSGEPIFEKMKRSSMSRKIGGIASRNIWQEVVTYDELMINERQKDDKEYSELLNFVRCGETSEETIRVLETRVIDVPVKDKVAELRSLGKTPVCLFPTRKQTDAFNEEMLDAQNAEVKVIPCIDEVDETIWH